MNYGIFFLPSLTAADHEDAAGTLRCIVGQSASAEELGFGSVWLAEHHFHSFGGILSSPPVIGAAIAQRTAKIRIGTAVTLLTYHNPLRIAEDYATLDCLSGGRLEFGVGHGFIKWEALTFGTPLEELRIRFKENLEIILKAWPSPSLATRVNSISTTTSSFCRGRRRSHIRRCGWARHRRRNRSSSPAAAGFILC
jgi:alkanesulfonate monooxygenase SsuD/methylene tetrahydromethanopterin reductase-like flavin-dependent oxidoreductase (luciferase family)